MEYIPNTDVCFVQTPLDTGKIRISSRVQLDFLSANILSELVIDGGLLLFSIKYLNERTFIKIPKQNSLRESIEKTKVLRSRFMSAFDPEILILLSTLIFRLTLTETLAH